MLADIKPFTYRSFKEDTESLPWMDERYFPRWTASKKVIYITEDGQAYRTITNDLGGQGMSIYIHSQLKLGSRLMMSVYLEKDVSVDVTGEIIWKEDSPHGILAGILIDPLPHDVHQKLLEHAFSVCHI